MTSMQYMLCYDKKDLMIRRYLDMYIFTIWSDGFPSRTLNIWDCKSIKL